MPSATSAALKKTPTKKGHPWDRVKYGATWRCKKTADGKPLRPFMDWEIERNMYLHYDKDKHPPGWISKAEHFMRMISIIFASPISKRPFIWNPNSRRIVEAYFKYDFLAVAGHASSSKSETIVIIALGEFIADPFNTAVLTASTTLSESRGRGWGRVEFYWQECVDYFDALGQSMGMKPGTLQPPGVLISSSGMIRFKVGDRKDPTRGIRLVPGRESEVKEGVGRLKGFKAIRMRFFVDEMSDLSHKLLEAAETNLYVNKDFKMIGCFNPASYFDPAGVFSEPLNGWSSVNILESDGWKTKRGYCIRFDGASSPNVIARREVWPGLLTYEKYEGAKSNPEIGENSPAFYQMFRGAWSETGRADGIYSESEIIKNFGMQKVDVWEGQKVKVGGFDPSFAHGGDRAVLVTGWTGKGTCFGSFKPCVEVDKIIYLDENLDTKRDKREQVLDNLKRACQAEGLDPYNLAIDSTGGGDVFVTLMNRDPFFARKFMAVGFGEQASDLMMGNKTGKEKFVNKVSELWWAGRPLLHGGQLRGLKPDIVREMTLRLYEGIGEGKRRIKVESKEDMKKRLNGRSCDNSDACFLMIFVCRAKHGLKSDGSIPLQKPKLDPQKSALDDPFAWGRKKKHRLNEAEFVPHASSAGWGDESSSFGGMF